MTKKKQKQTHLPLLQTLYDTYCVKDGEDALVRCERYMNDPTRIMRCGGRQYYRIAAI